MCQFPVPMGEEFIGKQTPRLRRRISLTQFPVVCANARTVHKLQGRSITDLVISAWDWSGNWAYVVLSRVRRLKGLYLRKPCIHAKTKGMSEECKEFHEVFRRDKKPPNRVVLHRSDV